MHAKTSPEVLVVGAGPVGLLAALMLAERGVHVQVVDRDWRTGAHSYALALHAASLQLLAELGLAETVLENAYRVESIGLYDGHQHRNELKLNAVDAEYPYVAVMPQDVFERVLETALGELGVDVLWNHEVAGLTQRSDHVAVTLNRLEKQSVGYAVAHTEWVVAKTIELKVPLVLGADGHRSMVRRSLGIQFPEVGPAQNFAVFEFQSGAEVKNQMQLAMADHLISAMWPLPYGYCRWSFQLGDVPIPVSNRQKRRVTVEIGRVEFPVLDASRLGAMIAQRAPWFSSEVEEIRWQIAVRFERRLASRFGQGRLWLAGDAGHMTGPVGMHSMNVGLREARDLAHLFEGILGGGTPLERLETYNCQRIEEWRYLLGLDSGLQATDAVDSWLADHREELLPCLPASDGGLKALAEQVGLAWLGK